MSSPHRIIGAAELLLSRYPEASLIDVYKSFFQDAFGPSHLISDPDAARSRLARELQGVTIQGQPIVEPCGAGLQHCRVYLEAVVLNLVSADELLEGFLESASLLPELDIGLWLDSWQHILAVLRPFLPEHAQSKLDEALIEQAVRSGSPAVSHSEHYRQCYDPHYRVISIHTSLFAALQQAAQLHHRTRQGS